MTLRILVVSTPIFKFTPTGTVGYSGLEHLAWQQANGLAKKGHDVSLVCPDDSYCQGVKLIHIGEEKKVNEKQAFYKYKDLLPSFDVILDHSWGKFTYLEKAKGLKTPVLGVLHAPVNTMYQTIPPNVDNPCFVCISQDQASHFEAFYGRSAKVCYNGIDLSFYKPLNIPRNKRFLFLARFSTIKGPDLAIKACLEASVGLDLIGDTSITNEPELLEQCKKLSEKSSPDWKGPEKQIKIIGPASRGETVYWYSNNYCLLHPTMRFREPLGLAPLEAMACGMPVLTWNYGAMKETVGVIIGESCLVNSYEDFVKKVKMISQENMIIEDSRLNLRNKVKNLFSVEKMVDRIEELSLEAISTGGW